MHATQTEISDTDTTLSLGEVVRFSSGLAIVDALLTDRVRLAHLDPAPPPGASFERTGYLWSTLPDAHQLFGRVIDPLGRPLDGAPLNPPRIPAPVSRPLIGQSPHPHEPLWTGRKVIDLILALRRGRSHLVIGPPLSGKTGILLDAIANQAETDVVGLYAAVDGTGSTLQRAQQLFGSAARKTICIHAPANAPPALRSLIAPTAVLLGEQIRARGGHALVAIDRIDLHDDRFLSTAQLLDRAGALRLSPPDVEPIRTGSLTILATVDDRSQRVAELKSHADQRTALNADGSVDYKRTSGLSPRVRLFWWDYKSEYSILDFYKWRKEEGYLLQKYVDPAFRHFHWSINRGERLIALTSQQPSSRMSIAEQLVVAYAVSAGFANEVPPAQLYTFEANVIRLAREHHPDLMERLGHDHFQRREIAALGETLRREYGESTMHRGALER